MPVTLNARAKNFSFRHLFLADPDEGYPVASIPLAELADDYCAYEGCSEFRERGCYRHRHAAVRGVSKLIAEGLAFGDLDKHDVLWVRLSARGVLSPLSYSSVPSWFGLKPEMVSWARGVL